MTISARQATSTGRVKPQQGGTVAQYLNGRHSDKTVNAFLAAALSDNTLRAYRADLSHFLAWGGKIPATPATVARYLAQHATILSPGTLSRRLIAIDRAHGAQGLASPTHCELVKATLSGIRRTRTSAPRQAAPLLKNDVVQMARGLTGMRGKRDRAMLLIGFASALRRSELVALDVEDVSFVTEGLVIRLRRGKTDQEGLGRNIAIPYLKATRNCPCRALQAWLNASGIAEGALFRRFNRYDQMLPGRLSAESMSLVVKDRVAAIGLDPALYSGHSLRAGFVTSAARAGASTTSIRAQTGHKSDAMLQRYIRDSQIFAANPNKSIWR